MSKVFCRENALNQKLLEGIDILADNVASTMGPRGRTVIIHEKGRRPFIFRSYRCYNTIY